MINNWISQLLTHPINNLTKLQDNISSNDLLVDPRSTINPGNDYTAKDILEFEEHINSNHFNAFDLHKITK